jgi:hypothetical protein
MSQLKDIELIIEINNLIHKFTDILRKSNYEKLNFDYDYYNLNQLDDNKYFEKIVVYDFYIFKIYSYQLDIKDAWNILLYCTDDYIRNYTYDTLAKYYLSKTKTLFIEKINLTKNVYKNLLNDSMIGNFANIKLFLEDYKKELCFENKSKYCDYWLISPSNDDNYKQILYDLVNEYFDLDFVQGVIKIYEILFDIVIIKVTTDHPDYDIFYTNNNISVWNIDIYNVYENNVRIGTFYLDIYERDQKPSYPCLIEYETDGIKLPIDYIVQ